MAAEYARPEGSPETETVSGSSSGSVTSMSKAATASPCEKLRSAGAVRTGCRFGATYACTGTDFEAAAFPFPLESHTMPAGRVTVREPTAAGSAVTV